MTGDLCLVGSMGYRSFHERVVRFQRIFLSSSALPPEAVVLKVNVRSVAKRSR